MNIKTIFETMKREGAKRFFFNTGWIVVEKMFRMVLSLVIMSITARYLKAERYGLLSYGLTFIEIFTILCKLGIDNVIVNEIVKDRKETGRILGTTILLRMLSGLLSIGLTGVFILIVNPGQTMVLIITLIQSVSLLFVAFDTIDFWFQSNLQSKYSAISKSLAYGLVCVWRLAMVLAKASVAWFAIATIVDSLAMGVALLVFYYKNQGMPMQFSLKTAKRLISISHPFIISSLLVTLYTHMDRVMLGAMLHDNQASVGIYSAAATIANVWVLVMTALVDSGRPLIMKLKTEQNNAAYLKRLRQLICAVVWLSVATALFTTVFGGLMIHILYGPAYRASGSVLIFLMWSKIFSLIGTLRGIWIVCEGKAKYVKYFVGAGAALNLALNFALIPVIGALGAAIATLATEIVASVLSVAMFKATRPFLKILGEAVAFRDVR